MPLKKSKLKAIIFDMDGVLIDTSKVNWIAHNELLSKYGVHISDDEIKKYYLGRSLRDQLDLIREKHGIKEQIDVLKFSKDDFEIQLRLLKNNLKEDIALTKLLEDSIKSGLKLAVATSSTRHRALTLLEIIKVKSKFGAIITAEDTPKHKPHPDIFLEAAKKLGVVPENCVVFEDASNGIEAARAANMKVVGFLTESADKIVINETSDISINNFSEISLDKLKRLFI